MADCLRAVDQYAELNHGAIPPGAAAAFASREGRARLLAEARDTRQMDGHRARALRLLADRAVTESDRPDGRERRAARRPPATPPRPSPVPPRTGCPGRAVRVAGREGAADETGGKRPPRGLQGGTARPGPQRPRRGDLRPGRPAAVGRAFRPAERQPGPLAGPRPPRRQTIFLVDAQDRASRGRDGDADAICGAARFQGNRGGDEAVAPNATGVGKGRRLDRQPPLLRTESHRPEAWHLAVARRRRGRPGQTALGVGAPDRTDPAAGHGTGTAGSIGVWQFVAVRHGRPRATGDESANSPDAMAKRTVVLDGEPF